MNLLLLSLFSSQAQAGWDFAPILSPIIEASFYTAQDDFYPSVKFGAVGGVSYKKKDGFPLRGHTRVRYTQNFGSQLKYNGWGIGSFFGPSFGPVSLELGGDYMIDSYTVPGLYDGRFGALAVPARVVFDVLLVRVELAGGPIFILNSMEGDTREGLSADANALGFGDEYFYMVNARVGLGPFAIGGGFRRRVTAYGEDNSVSVQFLFFALGSNPKF